MYYTLGTLGCYLHRSTYMNHGEHVFNNVKNLFRQAESLAINSVTAKRRKLSRGRAQHERLQKPTLGALQNVC